MTKILTVITTEFVPYGGLTSVMMNYYRCLDLKEYHIDFASTNEPPESLIKEINSKGAKYYCLGRRSNVLSYIGNLRRILNREGYDVVHIHANSATASIELFAAWLGGTPKRIVHIHNSTCKHKIIHACLMPMFTRLYTDAIACSEKAGNWIFKKEFYILPNAIDTNKYSFNEDARKRIRQDLQVTDSTIIIGNVGKMGSEQKNHRFMIKCFTELCKRSERYLLVFVGDGVMREEYEKICNESGVADKVKFLGMRDDVQDLLSAMDVFFFPSLWEGLPLSVLEAQSTGLPCLISGNITQEVIATNLVTQLSLDAGIDCWVRQIENISCENRIIDAQRAQTQLNRTGFDITSSSKLLEEIYRKS